MHKIILLCVIVSFFALPVNGEFKHELSGVKRPWTHERFLNDESRFTFVIVPDRTGSERPGVFQEALRKANLFQPHFIMSVGDLIQGQMDIRYQSADYLRKQWQELLSFTSKSQAPFFYLVGNHDIPRTRRGFPRSNETSREVWKEFCGDNTYYYFIYKDVLFLCLNSMDGQDARPRQCHFTDAQIKWAKSVLEKHSDVKWTFVFVHQPDSWNSAEFDSLEKLLAGRKYTAFAGDWHHYTKFRRQNRNYYVLATAGGVSELRGTEYGEFDHITHVTVTPDGPVIVNVKLDGILDENVVTAANIKRPIRQKMDSPPLQQPDVTSWYRSIDAGMLKKHLARRKVSVNGATARIDGDPQAADHRWRSGIIPLDLPHPAGKKIRLSAYIKTAIVAPGKGTFQLRVRMANAKNNTIDYTGFIIDKSQNWQKMEKILKIHPDTVSVQLYIIGSYLSAGSYGEVRNISLEMVNGDAGMRSAAPRPAEKKLWQMTVDRNMIKKYVSGTSLSFLDGTIRVVGDPASRNNLWRRATIPLDLPSPAGKKIRLSADIKTEIANPGTGSFHVRVRMEKADRKTIDYVGFIIAKSQDWQRMSIVLPMHLKTVATQLYIVGVHLDENSFGEVRNIVIEEVK